MMRSLLLVLALAPLVACSSNHGATSPDASVVDSGDPCMGATNPSNVRLPLERCLPDCTPSAVPDLCFDGCNLAYCTCAGPLAYTYVACDAGVDGSVIDASAADSGSVDASLADSSVDSGAVDSGVTACSAASPCTDGAICIGGPACGDAWRCVFSGIACTEPETLCGCDGTTFTESRSCTTQPLAHLGACEAGANCDRSSVTCRRVEPACPDGEVAEIEASCFTGRCISIDGCACTSAAQCPMSDIYTCHMSAGRCGPYL